MTHHGAPCSELSFSSVSAAALALSSSSLDHSSSLSPSTCFIHLHFLRRGRKALLPLPPSRPPVAHSRAGMSVGFRPLLFLHLPSPPSSLPAPPPPSQSVQSRPHHVLRGCVALNSVWAMDTPRKCLEAWRCLVPLAIWGSCLMRLYWGVKKMQLQNRSISSLNREVSASA